MFIPSDRLRRVDTPDVPTPGVVPPVIPPVAPPGYTAAASAPAEGPVGPAAPKKPVSKGLLIGLIAGGAVLVVAAIIAVVVLVLPSIFGGGGTSQNTVIDITSEPKQTWDYDITGGNDEEFVDGSSTASSITSVGDNQVLIIPAFNYDAYTEGDAGWYEGYDEQYSDGYDAGLDYAADYEAYWDDYSGDVPYPEQEDYFPAGAYDDYEDWRGFQDGFYDAAYEQGEGYSQLEKPIDPDFTPTLSLVNLDSGKETWSLDLTDVFDDISFDSYVSASDVAGSNAVVVSYSTTNDDDESVAVVATLDKASGKVISTADGDRTFLAGTYEGDVILGVLNKDGDEATLGRYAVDGLDDDPQWEADVDYDSYGASVRGDYIFAPADKGGVTIDARTGEEAKFGDDLDEADYYFLDGQLLRIESSDDGYEIDGYNLDGKSVWDDSIETDDFFFGSEGTLFIAESKNDIDSELMRINPSNGSEMWGDAYGEDFATLYGAVGSNLILRGEDYDELLILDLGSGEEKATEKVDESSSIFLGDTQFYESASDELIAYGYDGEGDRWKFDVDEDSEYVRQVGRHLVVLDTDKLTLNGLAAK